MPLLHHRPLPLLLHRHGHRHRCWATWFTTTVPFVVSIVGRDNVVAPFAVRANPSRGIGKRVASSRRRDKPRACGCATCFSRKLASWSSPERLRFMIEKHSCWLPRHRRDSSERAKRASECILVTRRSGGGAPSYRGVWGATAPQFSTGVDLGGGR